MIVIIKASLNQCTVVRKNNHVDTPRDDMTCQILFIFITHMKRSKVLALPPLFL